MLFDTVGTKVPLERIRYLGTSIEIVGNSDEFPFAVDDSLVNAIPFGSVRFPINVKANDLPGSTGVIDVVTVTNGLHGTTSIDSQGRVLYTPNGGYIGTDQFTYTIEDSRQIRSQAKVTVRVGAADANDLVSLRMEVTNLNGTPITDIAVGGQFQLRGYVKDLRTSRFESRYLRCLPRRSLLEFASKTGCEVGDNNRSTWLPSCVRQQLQPLDQR